MGEGRNGSAISAPASFKPLYHESLLSPVNPHGDVGLVTLWSPLRTVRRKLDEFSPALLDPTVSRIAVVSNLYGDGMYAMFCNLLFNPQVRYLVAVGEDLGLATCDEIDSFLAHGLEDDAILGAPVKRVAGTGRVFPDVPEFDERALRERLRFRYLGKLSRPRLAQDLSDYLAALPAARGAAPAERVRVELPTAGAGAYRPSQPAAHQVVRARPLDCWEELVVRTLRFGRPVQLKKGPRLELANAKVVITDPAVEPRDTLARFGFDLDRFNAYGERILEGKLPDGIAYTYGNRLRGYFDQPDTLRSAIELLRDDPETRAAYVSVWDTSADLGASARATPCLTTLCFRRVDGRLGLTATYRTHNLLAAWLENVYGLMAIQRHVAERTTMDAGTITVISHSLTIDPASPRCQLAQRIADGWTRDDDVDRGAGKHTLREDPNGYFVVSADTERGRIVAEHRYGGVLVKRYEARRAVTIEREVAADMAVSLVSHALWLGRELTAKERLVTGGSGANPRA